MSVELDPRWEWIYCPTLGGRSFGSDYVKGRCNHLEVVAVQNLDGDLVAQLCATCDTHWYAGRTLDEVP